MPTSRSPAPSRRLAILASGAALLASSPALGQTPMRIEPAQQAASLYELRTYHAAPGRLDAVVDQFRLWIRPGLLKVGMRPIGFWIREDEKDPAVIYILAFPDRAERDRAWQRFRADPEIERGRIAANPPDAPQSARPITAVDSIFMTPTTFAPAQP